LGSGENPDRDRPATLGGWPLTKSALRKPLPLPRKRVKKGLFPEDKRRNIGLVNGTLSASAFSCFADRQERRPGLPACHRSSRTRGTFRKITCSAERAHWPINTSVPAKSRTTTLGPFGEVIRATGPIAKVNPIRFSTKYDDDESDLLYFGYRYYKPSTGDWMSSDPLTEPGFYLITNGRQVSENSSLSDDDGGSANINDFLVSGGPSAYAFVDDFREERNFNHYNFIGNNPQDHYDLFGLTGRGTCHPNGHCGPDVTHALTVALADAKSQWFLAGSAKRALALHSLFTQGGWDTILVTSKNLVSSCNQSVGCKKTVTVNGVCYLGPEVNYVLFGYMCQLAAINEPEMVSAVIAQKMHKIWGRGGYDWQMRGAVSWAIAGYNGWPNTGVPYSDILYCDPCSDVYPDPPKFWWYVKPLGEHPKNNSN